MDERKGSEHRQVCELIPWYVNGTLGEQDMDQVSAHVSECAECAQEVEREVEIARRMRSEPPALETLVASEAVSLAALRQQLRPSARGRGTGLKPVSSHWGRWPALAAGFMIAIALGFLAGRTTNESTYMLMTAPSTEHGNVVQVIFHPTASEQDLRLLLSDSGGRLLGGPSAKGVYRIALPNTLPNGMDSAGYANRLSHHPAVRWAEVELP